MYERLSPDDMETILKDYEALAPKWGVTIEHARQMGMRTILPGQRPNNLKSEIFESHAPTPGGPKPTTK